MCNPAQKTPGRPGLIRPRCSNLLSRPHLLKVLPLSHHYTGDLACNIQIPEAQMHSDITGSSGSPSHLGIPGAASTECHWCQAPPRKRARSPALRDQLVLPGPFFEHAITKVVSCLFTIHFSCFLTNRSLATVLRWKTLHFPDPHMNGADK